MKSRNGISRRNFIGNASIAAAAITIVPRHVLGGRGYTAPSDLVNVGVIGCGNQGCADVQQLCDPDVLIPSQPLPNLKMKNLGGPPPVMSGDAGKKAIRLANIYALCDVDSKYAGRVFRGYPKAKAYTDYREMLEKERSIDAVLIATPDHLHATIASMAMQLKKHVYLEKPLAKTIHEVRALMRIAKENGVVTQMGNQGHAKAGTLQTVEWIQSGVIGNVKEVYMSTDRPVWDQGDLPRPEKEIVPSNLNWDLWLGPAPEKPYSSKIAHFGWRGFWDYGTGALGDMGAHIFDAPIWALKLGLPEKVQASSTPYSDEYCPQSEWVTYEFGARGNMPPVKMHWLDGGITPPRPDAMPAGVNLQNSTIYIGEKGIIMHGSHGADPVLVSGDKSLTEVKPWLARTKGIYEDWIDAIKNGTKSCNDFEISGNLTEILLLANIAVKMKDKKAILEYDPTNLKMTNMPEASELFHYQYRPGWIL